MDTAPRRLGLIVPSSNTVMEPDLYQNLPNEVTLHTARMFLTSTTPAGERKMILEYLPRAAQDLASARPHLVVFGCTSAGALLGAEGESRMLQQLATTAGAQVVGVVQSVQAALQSRRWNRVAVLTPYVPDLNQRIRESIERIGMEVADIAGLGITDNFEIASVSPSRIAHWAAARLGGVAADGIFISCTNFRALPALQLVTQLTGLPAVSSNSCVLETVRELLGLSRGDRAGKEDGR